jgi:hypothetical protein
MLHSAAIVTVDECHTVAMLYLMILGKSTDKIFALYPISAKKFGDEVLFSNTYR